MTVAKATGIGVEILDMTKAEGHGSDRNAR